MRVVYIFANPPSPVPEGSEEGSPPRTTGVDDGSQNFALFDAVNFFLEFFSRLLFLSCLFYLWLETKKLLFHILMEFIVKLQVSRSLEEPKEKSSQVRYSSLDSYINFSFHVWVFHLLYHLNKLSFFYLVLLLCTILKIFGNLETWIEFFWPLFKMFSFHCFCVPF